MKYSIAGIQVQFPNVAHTSNPSRRADCPFLTIPAQSSKKFPLQCERRDVVVPIHPGKPLATGTLAHILKRARITPEELKRFL